MSRAVLSLKVRKPPPVKKDDAVGALAVDIYDAYIRLLLGDASKVQVMYDRAGVMSTTETKYFLDRAMKWHDACVALVQRKTAENVLWVQNDRDTVVASLARSMGDYAKYLNYAALPNTPTQTMCARPSKYPRSDAWLSHQRRVDPLDGATKGMDAHVYDTDDEGGGAHNTMYTDDDEEDPVVDNDDDDEDDDVGCMEGECPMAME